MALTDRPDGSQPAPTSFAGEVHTFLVQLDPSRFSLIGIDDHKRAIERLEHEAVRCLEHWGELPSSLAEDGALKGCVAKVREGLRVRPSGEPTAWFAVRDDVAPLYEALATALKRHGVPAHHLHPTNHRRTFFHVLSGVVVVGAFEYLMTPRIAVMVAATFCTIAWSIEITRRFSTRWNELMMRVFRPIAREHERYRVNSSTWYGTALLLVSLTRPDFMGMLGILALAVGDPSAAYVGRRFGRVRVMRGRSLEGALAFAAAAFVVGGAYLWALHGASIPLPRMALLAGTAAIVGAVTELLSTRLDDNFTIPVFTAWGVGLVNALLA